MSEISHKWKTTKDCYLKWCLKSELKVYFSKYIFYEKLSLWWITKTYEKDALNDNSWFANLNDKLNKKKVSSFSKEINLFYEFFKTTLKLIKTIILLFFIKIFYKEKISKKSNQNCLYVYYPNLIKYKDYFIDAQYGLLTQNKNQITYIIQLQYSFSLIYNFFKIRKKLKLVPVDYYIANKHLSVKELIDIYFNTAKKFFVLNQELKKKNYFLIEKKNCSKILKPLLLKSFFGTIQDSLSTGISFRNVFKNTRFKNFISYLEFYPSARAVYYFLKDIRSLKLISINHANYSDNMLAYSVRKNEFSSSNNYFKFSPSPDIFFTQGDKYFRKLKKIFPHKKIFQIGSLKIGIQDINFTKKSKLIRFKNEKINKKIIVICLSTHDYLGITEILNNCNLDKFFIVVRPHPHYFEETLSHFKKKNKFNYHLLKKISTREIIKKSDFVITGDSSIGYESVIMGKKNVIRLYNEKYHPLYDYSDGITTVKNSKILENYLNENIKIKNITPKKLIEKFFFRYDKHAHTRLLNILKKL